MNDLWAALAAAVALGAAHALEVDHMIAVTAIVGGRPRVSAALAHGLRWGVGHAAVVLAAGTLLALSGLTVPERFTTAAELLVGAAMIALGCWAARNATRMHLHDPQTHESRPHDHPHAHLHAHHPTTHPHHHAGGEASRRHGHIATIVGAAHGLAGTAPAVALIPVTLLDDTGAAVGYLAAFGIGTTFAMALYAGLAAAAVGRATHSVRAARVAATLTAAASVVVGSVWIARALAAG
ncbi:MAG TPA: hypothetical protein VGA37_08320 [Gemmatimonadales bacterium]